MKHAAANYCLETRMVDNISVKYYSASSIIFSVLVAVEYDSSFTIYLCST